MFGCASGICETIPGKDSWLQTQYPTCRNLISVLLTEFYPVAATLRLFREKAGDSNEAERAPESGMPPIPKVDGSSGQLARVM